MPTFDEQTNQVWWLGIDLDYCRYEDLRRRRVIAQGWPHLGNLQALFALAADPANEALFKAKIEEIFGEPGGDNAPNPLWNLSQIRAGDLVVGAEGTLVRGVCQAKVDAWASYRFDEQFNYANAVCYPVLWHIWNAERMGKPPRVGKHGVYGCMKVQKERDRVIEAWANLIRAGTGEAV